MLALNQVVPTKIWTETSESESWPRCNPPLTQWLLNRSTGPPFMDMLNTNNSNVCTNSLKVWCLWLKRNNSVLFIGFILKLVNPFKLAASGVNLYICCCCFYSILFYQNNVKFHDLLMISSYFRNTKSTKTISPLQIFTKSSLTCMEDRN